MTSLSTSGAINRAGGLVLWPDGLTLRSYREMTWRQISSPFENEPRTLLFESVNEPLFDNATAEQKTKLLDELNTSFHEIVRSSGGQNAKRLLVLPTQYCTPDQAVMDDLYTTIKRLDDPNLVATVHY
ncbi:cellulase family glycosylhydrolase [Streptomyces sp. NPDC051104]|uniref:cellulase family glycosylhydrolase n=1 Tax=Streptomyces sp. NPDC051104 TaxID=3155044 RepID=UPI003415F004